MPLSPETLARLDAAGDRAELFDVIRERVGPVVWPLIQELMEAEREHEAQRIVVFLGNEGIAFIDDPPPYDPKRGDGLVLRIRHGEHRLPTREWKGYTPSQ